MVTGEDWLVFDTLSVIATSDGLQCMVVDGDIPHREMLIGIIEGAARDCEFTTPHETKERRTAYRP